ncbi:hypothetical protein GJ744_002440 [Endocarpon pusillum]|uniref:Cyclase n=2 Tax=Endocarpon pusillum TaxID=364733 RepID=A0A8H7AFN3_9EURO|nr:hypothetical protein GJ744_002440 [Endocarpon pusillum]
MSGASNRLTKIKDALTMNKTATTIPWDPDCTIFPTRKELPTIPGAPPEAAWVWGEDDHIGRLNLLTPTRIKAASAEIKTGEVIPLDLPLNVPEVPGFSREQFKHKIKVLAEGIAYDDIYELNTQSGTQWDGFRHFAHISTNTFYNGVRATDIVGPSANHRDSIHHWANHGITGRAFLLDYYFYAQSQNITYSAYSAHGISYADLAACGKAQGIDIRPAAQGGDIKVGDILLIRSGFVGQYHNLSSAERKALALRQHTVDPATDGQRYAGLKQEEAILDWLHDCYFAAVGGDAPAFERWPTTEPWYMHEYILALWGMPLGEMLDLERLSKMCKEKKRWFFFFTSAVNNCPGGVSSHVNGSAIF